MDKARYGSVSGKLVGPVEFITLASPEYKKHGIFPYCDACHEIVHLYGAHTTNIKVTPRFDHADRAPEDDPLDDCILANRNDRLRRLEPDGFDDTSGELLRAQFFEETFLRKAYAFCLARSRKGNLPATKFKKMIERADRKRVWSYIGVELWAIPYILLTLENFSAKSKNGKEYGFHFVLDKPRGSNISALWQSDECKLVKVFSSNGEQVEAKDNPFVVSENGFLDEVGGTSWITSDFLQRLVG